MAKTIKFNLICDNKPIRTIEDLQNNFSVEDILEYFQNGLLLRWLYVRGYKMEFEKVKRISDQDPMVIIKKLVKIFEIEADMKSIEQDLYIFEYLREREELYSIYEEQGYKVNDILDDYETGYIHLVDDILDNPDNMEKIKQDIACIVEDYGWIFELDHRRLYYLLKDISPLAIMCLLMNEVTREYYLPLKVENEQDYDVSDDKQNPDETDSITVNMGGKKMGLFGTPLTAAGAALMNTKAENLNKSMESKEKEAEYDIAVDADKREMYTDICKMVKTYRFRDVLGDKLIKFSGVTDGYWKDLESKGKEYMIISIGAGDYVRPAGVQGGDLSNKDITDKFVIINGIDYKSNSSTRKIMYMEV